jgi:hypothetical protein
MPFIIPLAISAVSAVMGGLSAGGGPSSSDTTKQVDAAALKQLQADQQAKQKAILANLPGAQEQSGGALSGPGLTDLAAVIAGLPGESGTGAGKGALASFMGTGAAPGGTSGTGAASGGSNFLEALFGTDFGKGAPQQPSSLSGSTG